jgi:tRNA(adenine34) deaminase
MQNNNLLDEHEKWMSLCIELAKQALQRGNPPVGSIIVKEGIVLGQGIEAGKTKKDVTCHAEIEAVRDAVSKNELNDLSGCTLYSTHEPCLMCSYVIRHYKISFVVSGTSVPFIGGSSSPYPLLKIGDISIWADPPQIIEGVLKEACQALSKAYVDRNIKQK